MRLGVVGNKLKGPALAIDNRSDYNKAFQKQKSVRAPKKLQTNVPTEHNAIDPLKLGALLQ